MAIDHSGHKGAARIRALLVNPTHNDQNIWSYDRMCEALGAKFFTPPLGLLSVAALLPDNWQIRLLDRNFNVLSAHDLQDTDVVLTGGMLTQRSDTLEVIRISQKCGVPVVVGGFDVSASPAIYANADVIVVGEAETCIDELVPAAAPPVACGADRTESNVSDSATCRLLAKQMLITVATCDRVRAASIIMPVRHGQTRQLIMVCGSTSEASNVAANEMELLNCWNASGDALPLKKYRSKCLTMLRWC
ncbi:MAG: cobalamin B12-binding domain-containing protein [Gammaproteobacteria bacterium]|nr:cobalamin B12-binding domain-containing protein [Alphaproteobacteria bacterium]MBM4224933.1 cobalamin B12-binding domain-containing protein [Gammaproteobacteria bacterium]